MPANNNTDHPLDAAKTSGLSPPQEELLKLCDSLATLAADLIRDGLLVAEPEASHE